MPRRPLLLILLSAFALGAMGCSGMGSSMRTAQTLSTLPAVGTGGPTFSRASTPNLSSVPDWALAPAARDVDSETGIGSGATLEEATRMALRDMASRISVSVKSKLRDVYREKNGRSASSVEQVVETEVLGTRFTGWERTRVAEAKGVYWAEVKIDRARLIRDSRLELNQLAERISAQLAKTDESALQRLMALQTTSIERARIRNLVMLLNGVDPSFDRKRYDALRLRWSAMDQDARRALVFHVSADPASREIARWLESHLAAERFTTQPGECAVGDAICIEIRSDIVETDVAQRFVAKIRSHLAILDSGGRMLQARDLVGRGDSSADAERARQKALKNLRKQFVSTSVLDGLIESLD